MTAASKIHRLPDPVVAAWLREIAKPTMCSRKAVRLFDRVMRPIGADLAAALAPSECGTDGVVRLNVPLNVTFQDDFIGGPDGLDWFVDFDPRTGNWSSPGAAPWEAGIPGLAAHVWRVMGRSQGGPMAARQDLLARLGLAYLYTEAAR